MTGKFIGTYLPLRLFSPEMSKYGGLLFNYRLSFGLVAAIYGFERNLISAEIFNTILLCVLFSSLGTTYVEKKLNPFENENARENIFRLALRYLRSRSHR
jgi:Kef-type K+ transport system membrane component KefB